MMNKCRMIAAISKILMILSFCFLSSCVAIPYPYHEVYEGHEIEKSGLSWLEPGVTKRSDVINKLGEPNLSLVEQNAIVYIWGGQEGGVWVIYYGGGSNTHHFTIRKSMIILFDKNDVVADYTFVERTPRPILYDYKPSDSKSAQDNWRNILARWLKERTDKSAATIKRSEE